MIDASLNAGKKGTESPVLDLHLTPSAQAEKALPSPLAGPAVVVTEAELINAYFEPLMNTAKNLAPSEREIELKKRREKEVRQEDDENARREQEMREKELERDLHAACAYA